MIRKSEEKQEGKLRNQVFHLKTSVGANQYPTI
jgi:hypothetical protein